MSEWRNFFITELADFCNAQRIPLSSMERVHRKGNFPYYGASGIVDYIDNYIFDGSYILISEDGENLKSRKTPIAFEATGKFWVNNHAHILMAKKPHLTELIIQYFSQLDLSPYLTGAAQPKLNKASLNLIPLYLPVDELEQKAIASVLSSLDDKINLLHRQNKTLESMSEIIFRQCFIVNEQEQWVNGTIEDLYVLQRGFDLPSNQRVSGKFNLYAASGLNDNIDSYKVDYPTIITGRSGVIGKVYYSLDKSWPLNTTLYIKDFKIAAFWFAYFHLKTLDLSSLNSGSAVPTLNRNHVHSLEVKLPPKDLISKFEDDVSAFMIKFNENLKQILNLEKLRDTLLPKLMSGEVRVQYAEEAIASVA